MVMANRTTIENLQDLIKDNIGGELVEQKAESLLPPGENYGSVIYKVDFKVKKDGKEEEYHAVAKCTPLNPVTRELFNIQETFKSEIAWYTTIIPALKEFQQDHVVQKGIDFFQPLYGARTSLDPTSEIVDLNGTILTQNLKYLGYENVDRHIGFDLPTTYNVLRDLATFHAVPLAMRVQKPELFDKKIKSHLSLFAPFEGEMKKGFSKPLYVTLDKIPECQSYMDKIRKYVDEAILFRPHPVREPWVTLVHMDFWVNNIMVTGGENSKTMILDLQFPHISSPASDLVFFLLTSVKLDEVREKYDDFVKFYYDQFIKNLKELNVSIDDYPFEALLEEISAEVKIGELVHSLSHSYMMLSDKGKSGFDASDENFKMENFQSEPEFEVNERQIEKFRWIVTHAIKKQWI